MAILNFPPTAGEPTDGSFTYEDNGVLYSWDGYKWEANSESGFDSVYVEVAGDNMTGNLTLGTDKITLNADGSADYSKGVTAGTFSGNINFTDALPAKSDSLNNTSKQIRAYNPDDSANYSAIVLRTRTSNASNWMLANEWVANNKGDLHFIGRTSSANNLTALKLTSDGDAEVHGDIQSTSQNGAQIAGFRNQIINGEFSVNQMSGSGSSAGDFPCDRWRTNSSRPVSYITESGQTPNNLVGCLQSDNTGDTLSIRTTIELPVDSLNNCRTGPFTTGRTYTLSVVAIDKSGSGGTLSPTVGWSDGSAGSGADIGGAISSQNTTSAWTKYSFPITITSSPSTTNRCISITLVLTGTGNPAITGVQFEPGPVATPFEHRPIGTELTLCQRYYQTIDNYALTGVTRLAGLSGTIYASGSLQTTMRKSPTGTRTTNMSRWNTGGDIIEQQAISDNVVYTSPYSVRIYFKGSWNVGLKIGYAQSGGGPGIMATLDAEL